MRLIRPRSQSRPGTTLTVVTVLLIGLVGMLSLAIDVGYIAHTRTALQRSADAGALAGVVPLAVPGAVAQDFAAARAEARRFVRLNEGSDSFAVPDDDIQFGRYDPASPVGTRFTAGIKGGPVTAFRVTVRRDGIANGPLRLAFGPVIGRVSADVRAVATVHLPPGGGVRPGPDLLPYAIQIDYFNKAVGLPPRAGAEAVSAENITDQYTARDGQSPLPGPDGMNEVILFGSAKTAAGNFGSLDVGSDSNGTPDLVRQIVYGPNAADFAHKDFVGKVSADGALRAPVALGADPGISAGVESAFQSIVGQRRIVFLYSAASGTGNNTEYAIVGFAAVTVVAVDLHGNPKRVWVQPTGLVSAQVAPRTGTEPTTFNGVFAPPRLVIP